MYYIKETVAPAGYVLLPQGFKFKISKGRNDNPDRVIENDKEEDITLFKSIDTTDPDTARIIASDEEKFTLAGAQYEVFAEYEEYTWVDNGYDSGEWVGSGENSSWHRFHVYDWQMEKVQTDRKSLGMLTTNKTGMTNVLKAQVPQFGSGQQPITSGYTGRDVSHPSVGMIRYTGRYYAIERKAPPEYELCSDEHQLSGATGANEPIKLSFKCPHEILRDRTPGEIKITKKSSNPNLSDNNRCYSLAGAEYTLYYDRRCQKVAGKGVTDESGIATIKDLVPATYYVKETKAPKGFDLCQICGGEDGTPHSVTIKGGEIGEVKCTDPPLDDPLALTLNKLDADTGEPYPQGTAELSNAIFKLEYWDNTDGSTSGTPKKTWFWKTNDIGQINFNNNSYLLDSYEDKASDDLYTKNEKNYAQDEESGEFVETTGALQYTYPLGTYKFTEVQPPKYYNLDGTMQFAGSSEEVNPKDGIVLTMKENEHAGHKEPVYSSGTKTVNVGNFNLNVKDKIYKCSLKILKKDGSTPLSGVKFKLVGRNEADENGNEIVLEGVTDENGEYTFKDLIPQAYILTEITAQDGKNLLPDNINIDLPLDMTEEEANAVHADTAKAKWDKARNCWSFCDLTYTIDNGVRFSPPTTGGKGIALGGVALGFALIGGGIAFNIYSKRKKKDKE